MRNTKIKFNKFLAGAIVLLLSIFLFVTFDNFGAGITSAYDYQGEKTIEIPNLDDDFDDSCVVVIIDKKTSKINKKFDNSYFGNAGIESVEDLTYITGNIDEKVYLNKEDFRQIFKLNLQKKSKLSVIDTLMTLKTVEGISWAGPNYIDKLPQMVSSQIDLMSIKDLYHNEWGLYKKNGINITGAWNITKGDKRVKVGVLDTGIANHKMLESNLGQGWDFINNNAFTTDDNNGHGTHVAGIIGMVPLTDMDISGVCPNVQLIPLQVADDNGEINLIHVVGALNWAIANDVDILNYSAAGYTYYEPYKLAINNYKGLFICAASNEANDNDVTKVYPSDYSYGQDFSSRVISVGAIREDGKIARNSNYGAKSVSIFAPGEMIESTYPTNLASSGYQFLGGTSMAAPFVTGTAALMFSLYLDANSTGEYGMSHADIAAEIKELIIKSATYESNLDGKCVANGRLNAYNAVRLAASFDTTILSDYTLRINGIGHNYFDGKLEIPQTIKGRLVSQIGPWAFANNSAITDLELPPYLKEIGYNAFQNNINLKNLKFKKDSKDNNYLTTIGNAVFYNCTSLSSLSIPDNVVSIGYNAFENCDGFTSVNFSQNSKLSVINNSAFAGCSQILALFLPTSVKTIGALAFKDCSKMLSLKFLQGESKLTDIGNSAFDGCTSLGLLKLPKSLKNIGAYAFNSCSYINNVTLSDNVTSIGAYAFAGCTKLTIFTSLPSALNGWASNWNSANRPIVYGCEVSNTNSVMSFTKTATNPTNRNAENGINNPYHYDININFGGWYTTADFSGTKYDDIASAPNGKLYVNWVENTCVAEGSLITLADGTQKAVEDLTGDEQLLVWNMFTGTFDTAPILFIDSESRQEYEVIKLSFSDGTTVKVISEHAFWDFDLNKYVFLRADAARYIGHWFNKQTVNADGEKEWSKVQLVDVELTREITAAYSPVTYGHLCYYVNGMLSMPGATEGLINIFDVDGDTMKIDEAAFNKDIEKYGLFTYEEFAELLPISEEVFDAFGGQYLKVAIGKGLIDIDKLAELIARYAKFF